MEFQDDFFQLKNDMKNMGADDAVETITRNVIGFCEVSDDGRLRHRMVKMQDIQFRHRRPTVARSVGVFLKFQTMAVNGRDGFLKKLR